MPPEQLLHQRLSEARFLLQRTEPFFGSLLMHLDVVETTTVPTAATDGQRMFFNPDFAAGLTEPELRGVLLHELLHAALEHVGRRRHRDPLRWNIAADIVVNGIVVRSEQVELPAGTVREIRLEDKDVEEVYELLGDERFKRLQHLPVRWHDLLPAATDSAVNWPHTMSAVRQALEMQGRRAGDRTRAEERILQLLGQPSVDWRTVLWRHAVRTPVDYTGFDRRQVYRGLYTEELHADQVELAIAVDTSGSVDNAQLGRFMAEVRGILASYPSVKGALWYADTALYGPFDPHDEVRDAKPRGGGGTSFVPFCNHVRERPGTLAIYLTDGYGNFPKQPPPNPLLWVVLPGGLENRQFPFGEVVRMVDR